MTTKLKLTPDPAFDATVPVPVPGKDPVPVRFTFKHQSVNELQKFLKKEQGDVDYVLGIAEGWEIPDPWNRKNVTTFLNNYAGAARAIAITYLRELTGAAVEDRAHE